MSEKIHDSMKAYLKSAFILRESDRIKVYDEKYDYLGEIPLVVELKEDLNSDAFDKFELSNEDLELELKPKEVIKEGKQEEGKTYIDPSLKFNLKLGGEKFASKVADGFFFLYNTLGENVFEYFTDDIFMGLDEDNKCLLFKEESSAKIYGKSFDGRRVEISDQQISKNITQSNVKEIPEIKEKKELEPELSKDKIVGIFMTNLRKIIKNNKISVEYFISEKLDNPSLNEILLKVLDGDLSQLNEEIEKESLEGVDSKIPPGLSSIKAALLHELFINSTLTGRGGHRSKNMRSFLYELILLDQSGKLSSSKKKIPPKIREKGVEFINQLSQKFTDKTDVIHKVYYNIKIDDEYMEMSKIGDDFDLNHYKAFLISKLYEYTTRIDRGNGISIINVSKALMDVG